VPPLVVADLGPDWLISFSIFELRFVIVDVVQRAACFALVVLEVAILSVLILVTRWANYPDVFVGGNVYFTDADCYARMTRVRMCAEHPGLIVRHQNFENFPQGTTPHTTAPLDYLIVGLSIALRPLTAHSLDLAGALISPLLALLGGWFLWWWSRRMRFRYRWAALVIYAISPILVHGAELGRPDHQSLSMLLVTVAICAEWSRRIEAAGYWSEVSGITWGLALWVSAYEPLILFLLVVACRAVTNRADRRRLPGFGGAAQSAPATAVLRKRRRLAWILFALVIAVALLIERRIPSFPAFRSVGLFRNWSRTIGELAPVPPLDPVWFRWAGYLIVLVPILAVVGLLANRKTGPDAENKSPPLFLSVLLVATYLLTIWEARWGYFFLSMFAVALPGLLQPFKLRVAVWTAFAISLWPVLRSWDQRLWPNESELAAQIEHRSESVQLRELAATIRSSTVSPFLAPWWLSPSITYWSGQPAIAGSSHESLAGIVDSARFFLAQDWQKAREILLRRRVTWVFAYDADRAAQNSAAILGEPIPGHPMCWVIDRRPSQAPGYLVLSAQNGAGRVFRVRGSP
jgi:hypothetical protein